MFGAQINSCKPLSAVRSKEQKGKLSLLRIFLVISLIPLFSFAVIDFFEGNYLECALELFSAIWMLSCLILLGRYLSVQWVSNSMATIYGLLFIYLAAHGDTNGTKLYFSFVYPVFTFYLQGTKNGLLWNIVFILCLLVVLFNPAGLEFVYNYTVEGNIRFLVAYSLVAALSYFYENVRNRIQLDLEAEKDKLYRAHTAMEESNVKLQLANEESRYLAKQANRANQAKSEFLANMSHELRTPLNGVVGMAHLLQQSNLNQEQYEFAKIIQNSSESLLEIINDILDFSKIEAGKVDLNNIEFELHPELERFFDTIAYKAHEKGLEVSSIVANDVPPILIGDPGRLRQILINLVGNAIKFTQSGEIILRVHVDVEDVEHVILKFRVIDTGIGVSSHNMKLLFQSFSQIDSSATRKYGGTGLGLMISKRLAELMRGHIGVESQAGAGAEFWFTARFAKPLGAKESKLLVPQTLRDLRVLLIEGNTASCESIHNNFAKWQIEYNVAHRKEDAVRLLQKKEENKGSIDIVLIDSCIEGVDGAVMAEEVAQEVGNSKTQFVLLSPLTEIGQYQLRNKNAFSAYLSKPVKRSQLYQCLANLTGIEKDETSVVNIRINEESAQAIETRKENSELIILLVEDNDINQFVALKLLLKLGYEADAVSNGEEAIRALRLKTYDLVLMDCQMPVMDGYEATRVIRESDPEVLDPELPIIAMTAHAIMGDEVKCLDAGMSDYLSKPVEPEKLAKILKKWQGKKHSRKIQKDMISPN